MHGAVSDIFYNFTIFLCAPIRELKIAQASTNREMITQFIVFSHKETLYGQKHEQSRTTHRKPTNSKCNIEERSPTSNRTVCATVEITHRSRLN